MNWIYDHFEDIDNFPRPNWESIYKTIEEKHQDADLHELWCDIARSWSNKLNESISNESLVHESDNFILVTSESDRFVSLFLPFLERTLKRILSSLEGISSDAGYGKHIVLVFEDIDKYYSYLSFFYPNEGVYALSSGVYLNRGYGHFVFPAQDVTTAESVAVHEMTHALLAHLPIPLWLNEGIAVNMESELTGFPLLKMEKREYVKHQRFWGEEEIQEFWFGDSFSRPDEGDTLSYHLAQFAVHSLSRDYDTFVDFVNKAHHSDCGESAAHEVYEGSLGNLIAQYFGEGDWSPKSKDRQSGHSNNVTRVGVTKPAAGLRCQPTQC